MGEFVRNKKADGSIEVLKTTDAMLEEIGRLAQGWQEERDFIRTLCEMHTRGADPNSEAVLRAILYIVKGVRE